MILGSHLYPTSSQSRRSAQLSQSTSNLSLDPLDEHCIRNRPSSSCIRCFNLPRVCCERICHGGSGCIGDATFTNFVLCFYYGPSTENKQGQISIDGRWRTSDHIAELQTALPIAVTAVRHSYPPFDFSQDQSFAPDAFRRVVVPRVLWYRERQLRDVNLGSVLLLTTLRAITFNLHRLKDPFLLSNCCAVLLNISPHVCGLHSYAAMRLASVTAFLYETICGGMW